MTNEEAIMIIPATEIISGDSAGRIIQLSEAPATGIRNFQKFRFDTLTSGRFKRSVQIEIATAESMLNHAKERKYTGGLGFHSQPSIGIETRNKANPPIVIDNALNMKGGICPFSFAIRIFVNPDIILFPTRIKIPIKATLPGTPNRSLAKLTSTTPIIPNKILKNFRGVNLSSGIKR